MIALLKLIRYKNLLIVLLTMVLTKYFLIESFVFPNSFSDADFILCTFSVLLITAGGYIVNDIFDVAADTINKPHFVFIDTFISKKNAWYLYVLFSLSGLLIGIYLAYINSAHNIISLYFFCCLSVLMYAMHFKKVLLLGNLLVAVLCGIPILLVFLFHTNLQPVNNMLLYFIILFYTAFAFLTTFIREIIKDIEDVNGDFKINAHTLPIAIGRKRATKIAFILSCVLLLFLLLTLKTIKNEFLLLGYGSIFLVVPLSYFLYKLWFAAQKKDYRVLSMLLKIIMVFGILSMLLFKL